MCKEEVLKIYSDGNCTTMQLDLARGGVNCGGMQMNHHQELANGLSTWPTSSSAPSSPLVRGCIADRDVIIDSVRPGARNVDPQEYDPHHVSIGPYHYRQKHLGKDHEKEQGLTAVLSVATPGSAVAVAVAAALAAAVVKAEASCIGELEEAAAAAAEASCISELARLRHRARGCYGVEHIGMKSEEFVRMLLLDGCYILAYFGTVYPDVGLSGDTEVVVCDVLYLAENQVPFFVLERIVELTTPNSNTALDNIKEYAVALLNKRGYSMAKEPILPTPPGNLLHLLRMHLDPIEIRPSSDGEKVTRWHTATDYYLAGVKIKRQELSADGIARCILDVKVSGGALMIPCLDIDNSMWRLLRNLMALEQQNRRTVPSHVTAYCIFMSQLACEATDVKLLRKKKVIVHSHGKDDEVAKCFADLCKGINFDINDPSKNYLRMTWQELEKRYQNWWRRSLAWLWLMYFSNPWLAIGLIAAAIGVACGIVQAVYSVLSYRKG